MLYGIWRITNMIFLGDYANSGFVDLHELVKEFLNEICIVNLEGAVARKDEMSACKKTVVFNTERSIQMLNGINTKLVTMSNNHVFDLGNHVKYSKEALSRIGISAIGAGENIEQANEPFYIVEDGQEYVIFSSCWNVTGGKIASTHRSGVAPVTKKNIENCIKKAKEEKPGAKVIFILHWGIELELYPEPMHIELAHHAIDCGADLIIGHHPHCIQPIEKYKDKYIFYSIGNFYMEEHKYFNGRLDFPKFAHTSLAVRLTDGKITVYCLSAKKNTVKCNEILDSNEALNRYGFPPFEGKDYAAWFRQHRKKNKFVPIYYSLDAKFENLYKDKFLKLRGSAIKLLMFLHIKNGRKNSE